MRRSFLYNPKLKLRARQMRNEMTAAEKKLWYGYLEQDRNRWLRQKPIGDYIIDFYCPKLKLVIEVDGTTHLENKDKVYDKKRTEELEKLGIKILRFWNNDILDGLAEVANIVKQQIKNIKSPYPL